MRVALNVEQLLYRPPGGIGRYVAELVRLLPRLQPEPVSVAPFVALHSASSIGAAFAANALAVEPTVLPFPRPLLVDLWNVFGLADPMRLRRSLRDVDVVHAPSLAVPPRGGAPLVVTVHDAAPLLFPDTYPRRGRRFHRQGLAAAARRADVVIAPSLAATAELTAHTAIPDDRIRVIPHGVELREMRPEDVTAVRTDLGLGAAPFILWVGTFEPRKNVVTLVDAFAAVVRETALPHRLVLVGPHGWLGAAERVATAGASLGDRLRIAGPVAADRLAALYAGADLFAFPSRHEGFGLPVLEAMAQATAVVCSDLPVLRELAGDAARYVATTDVDGWAGALVDLLGDESARNALGASGRARAAERTWERTVERHAALYRSLA
jgi:glycosyltransferase involved in cell wall biosynthesis